MTARRVTARCRAALRRTSRGFGLFDAMIALCLLSFGLLGMTRFQGRMVAQATESQARQLATQFAAEQISTVLVDAGNAACYTRPQTGTCTNNAAIAATTDWANRTAAALPPPVTTTASLSAAGQMTLTINWQTKAQADLSDADAARRLVAITDVRGN